jgi:hypothetical protein
MGLVLVLAFVAPSQDDFWPVLKTASNESIQDARFNFEFEGAPVEDGEWQRQSTDKGTGITRKAPME